jgi:hypothetical protein
MSILGQAQAVLRERGAHAVTTKALEANAIFRGHGGVGVNRESINRGAAPRSPARWDRALGRIVWVGLVGKRRTGDLSHGLENRGIEQMALPIIDGGKALLTKRRDASGDLEGERRDVLVGGRRQRNHSQRGATSVKNKHTVGQ